MKFTPSLQELKKIIWRYASHHVKDGRRGEAEEAVRNHYKESDLESRGAEVAEIKSDNQFIFLIQIAC